MVRRTFKSSLDNIASDLVSQMSRDIPQTSEEEAALLRDMDLEFGDFEKSEGKWWES